MQATPLETPDAAANTPEHPMRSTCWHPPSMHWLPSIAGKHVHLFPSLPVRTLNSLLTRGSPCCSAAALSAVAVTPPPLLLCAAAGESSKGTSVNTAAVSAAAYTLLLASTTLLLVSAAAPAPAPAPEAASVLTPALGLASPAVCPPRLCSSMALSLGAPMARSCVAAWPLLPDRTPSNSSAWQQAKQPWSEVVLRPIKASLVHRPFLCSMPCTPFLTVCPLQGRAECSSKDRAYCSS